MRRFDIAMAALLSISIVSPVAAHGPDPILGGGRFTQDDVLSFRWRSGSEPPTAIKTAIRAAAADVEESGVSRAPTFVYSSTGTSPIGYGTGTCGVNGIGCFTRTAPDSFTMWLREHGRVYDWGTLRWCQMLSTPTNGCFDAENIALDEFGHVEILNHHVNFADDSDYEDAVVQTFSRTRPKVGFDAHAFGTCDTATLQLQYDIPLASTPISTCLDLVTVLTLASNYIQVGEGDTVTFTSSLRTATDTDYVRLSANVLSKRTVRLQRRPAGSSTWSTIATMTSSSPTGTYTTTLTLVATADYRAVFSTPSTEGLRGDTSSTITVSVTPCTRVCYSCSGLGTKGVDRCLGALADGGRSPWRSLLRSPRRRALTAHPLRAHRPWSRSRRPRRRSPRPPPGPPRRHSRPSPPRRSRRRQATRSAARPLPRSRPRGATR